MHKITTEDRIMIYTLINRREFNGFKNAIEQMPAMLTDWFGHETLLHYVVRSAEDAVEFAEFLISKGMDLEREDSNENGALESAIHAHPRMVEFLLCKGADPNHGRPLVGAINHPEHSMEMVRLLVEHGADVNKCWRFGDPKKGKIINGLSWADANGKHDIAEYLRSKGAKFPEELPREKVERDVGRVRRGELDSDQRPWYSRLLNLLGKSRGRRADLAAETVEYFQQDVGPVNAAALVEIVPDEVPISLHVVPPAEDRRFVTLFTTGMSARPMSVPPGNDVWRFAELFIQLPADWPLTGPRAEEPQYAWPIRWLRTMAKLPHYNQTWLGGPVTLFAEAEPPEPLWPGAKFTTLLLMSEKRFQTTDGRTVQLYRMLPLYTEERTLEIREGLPALMRALDQGGVPFVIDLDRKNVGK